MILLFANARGGILLYSFSVLLLARERAEKYYFVPFLGK